MKTKIILLSIFILLNSLSALTKTEIIKQTLQCCKHQLASNRKDAIGLMLLHYLTTETTNNRDVLLLEAKMKRGLDIKADGKGDLVALNKLFIKASVIYIKAKHYQKAAYYLKMAETLSPLSDNALINQHLLQAKGFEVTDEQLLGNGKIKPIKPAESTKKLTVKLPANAITFKIGDHHYALILEEITWKEAKAKAETFGGYLACVTSERENEAILKYVKRQKIWIGGTDEIQEGSFKWISGERFSYNNFTGRNPDNHGRGEDFLSYYEGSWNDMDAKAINDGYLVEWDTSSKEPVGSKLDKQSKLVYIMTRGKNGSLKIYSDGTARSEKGLVQKWKQEGNTLKIIRENSTLTLIFSRDGETAIDNKNNVWQVRKF